LLFSITRRQTRFSRDWSSDVCSADLAAASPLTRLLAAAPAVPEPAREDLNGLRVALGACSGGAPDIDSAPPVGVQVDRLREWLRSEERRVGKEGGAPWRR